MPTFTTPYTFNPSTVISSSQVNANFTAIATQFSTATTVYLNDVQTLTNKTIAASSNTITGLTNTNIDAAAAIAVTKLATLTASRAVVSSGAGVLSASTVTSTQIDYLAGASGTTGTTNLVYSASPTFTGTVTAATMTLSSTLTVTGAATLTGGIVGTVAGGNATAGNVGQYVETTVTTATNWATSGQYGDATSISLTAGDWDVTFILTASRNGATFNEAVAGISQTAGNSSTGLTTGTNQILGPGPVATSDSNLIVPNFRINLTSTTTIYGKISGTYTVATPQYRCRLSARRIR
jgi:hypothetical protein